MISHNKKISSIEFKSFYNKGFNKTSDNLRISFVNNETKKETKYAVVINKKIAKTAVLRHKNKRKIYKMIRQLYPQFLKYNFIFIFIKKDISNINDSQLFQEIKSLL